MSRETISDLAAEFILKQSMENIRQLTLLKVARNLGVSSAYLSRRFKKDQDITFSKFLLREKLHRAFFILTEIREKPVAELAKELGFATTKKFNIEFEKYHFISPARYKEIMTGTNPFLIKESL